MIDSGNRPRMDAGSERSARHARVVRRRILLAAILAFVVGTTSAFAVEEVRDDDQTGGPGTFAAQPQPSTGGPSTSSATHATDEAGLSPGGVYAAITSRRLSPAVRGVKPLVYVPNNRSNTLDVIDPKTYRIVGHYDVGYGPQHVTPSWDLKRLYVGNTYSNTVTVIDPRTGRPTGTMPLFDTYNLYFTPDGTKAIDVAERMNTLFFYDPDSWKIIGRVSIPWAGADHLDFSADGRYLLISTEFAGQVVRVDTRTMRVTGSVHVGGSPVDVKLAPDGSVFFVANQDRNGVSVVDPRRMREVRFIPTGRGAHGFCVSRDARSLYVSNRLAGTISVLDFATLKVVRTWHVGGSPDMMQVTPDGSRLWVSNRYDGTVSVIDTRTGRVLRVIRVGDGPHGLTYFPQPGRFSIGHNGVYR